MHTMTFQKPLSGTVDQKYPKWKQGKSLPLHTVKMFGKQILAGLLYLKKLKIPMCYVRYNFPFNF